MQLALLADQLVELQDPAPVWSLEAFASGHTSQLEVMTAVRTIQRILLMMARQVGKSWLIAGCHLDSCLLNAGSTGLALGLTGPAIRTNFWEPIWKPLLTKFAIDCKHNESRMMTVFPNGSRFFASGTDDLRHIQNFLGNRFKAGLISIDECQAPQQSKILGDLLRTILPPMLTPESKLILAGTIPKTPAGTFWNESLRNSWKQFSWGRVALTVPMPEGLTLEEQYTHLEKYLISLNPHTAEAPQVLVAHMRANSLDITDCEIQRDWFANRNAFDPNARTYFYRKEINGYVPEIPAFANDLSVPSGNFVCAVPHKGIDTFSVAIDPGGGDPWGITCIGYGKTTSEIQEVFSWQSDRDSHLTWSQVATICKFVQQHYPTQQWRYDTNADAELDVFGHEYNLPVIKAATKADMAGQIRRTNDLLKGGKLQIIIGGPTETDYLAAKLDPDAEARGQHKWSADYHPTCSETTRYALAAYWLIQQPPKSPKPQLDPFELEEIQRIHAAKYGRKNRK